MANNFFNKLITRGENFSKKSINNMYFNKVIYNNLANIISKLYSDDKEMTAENIEKILYGAIGELLKSQLNCGVKKIMMLAVIENELANNPNELKKIYNSVVDQIDDDCVKNVKDNPNKMICYGNYSKTRELFVKMIIVKLREQKNNIIGDKEAFETFTKIANMGTNNRRRLEKNMKITSKSYETGFNVEKLVPYFKGTESEQLFHWLKNNGNMCEDNVKKKCISGIMNNINFLDKFGILDLQLEQKLEYYKKISKILEIENSNLKDLILQIPYNNDEILKIFNEDNLKKLSIKSLIALNAEWSNITVKTVKDINNMLFLMRQLDLFDDIKDGKNMTIDNNSKINKQTLNVIFKKIYIMHTLSYKMLKDICASNEKKGTKLSARITAETQEYSNEYTKYFSNLLNNKSNNIQEDMEYYKYGENLRYNLYKQKDENIIALITGFMFENKGNWGVILEDENDINNRNIFFAFDVNDLTMPIRLHLSKEMLYDFLKNIAQTEYINIYKGNKDFYIGDSYISSYGVYPINRRYYNLIKKIKTNITDDKEIYNYIMHLNYLIDETEYPKSMKDVIGTDKKGKKKYVKSENVLNINTGKIISKSELQKIQEEQQNLEL